MRLQEIIGILTNHLFLVILAIIFCIGVFFIVKKISGGKIGSYKKLLPLCILLAYIVLVIGITFFNRGESGYGRVNLALFQSYKEAWYLFDLGHWQLVILNICMFIPFGFLMPIIHQRFKTFIWLFLAALLFTLMIETGQYITKVGLFELDDIFNNTLGAIVGYGLIMTIYSLIHKDWKQAMLHSIPNVCVVLAFLSIFTIYHLKEFGNLPIVAIENVDVSTSAMQNDLKLSSEEKSVPIYKAPTLSKNDADQFVTNFFAN